MMSEPFLAEIRIVGFNFAPKGWAFCDGQILPINQNQSLYSLLGTTYGGDGRTSFGLPDLRSRTPIHEGRGEESTYQLGQKGGAEAVPLTVAQIAAHNHPVNALSVDAEDGSADADKLPAKLDGFNVYRVAEAATNVAMADPMFGSAGNGQAHDNMQPYLTLAFCIALQGLFPSRN